MRPDLVKFLLDDGNTNIDWNEISMDNQFEIGFHSNWSRGLIHPEGCCRKNLVYQLVIQNSQFEREQDSRSMHILEIFRCVILSPQT